MQGRHMMGGKIMKGEGKHMMAMCYHNGKKGSSKGKKVK